jgi:glucan 1,3-beta-glucosidase
MPLAPSGYQMYRNVKDFGAVGDGVTDDTEAINNAVSSGNRCGEQCGSSTTLGAVIYFPVSLTSENICLDLTIPQPGTYLICEPIIQ